MARVPRAPPTGRSSIRRSSRARTSRPGRPSPVTERSRSSATAAMLASASPRKPRVWMRARSSTVVNLLVLWRSTATATSSAGMPQPSSVTSISALPPRSTATSTRRAPASSALSSSSRTSEAGRSITSPAAILPLISGGRRRMLTCGAPAAARTAPSGRPAARVARGPAPEGRPAPGVRAEGAS